jgi:VIT1/CCC1 family predicted Fe2+/Mn2+ transporter
MHKLIFLIVGMMFLAVTSQAAYIPDLAHTKASSEINNTTTSADNVLQQYETVTGRHLTRVEKWIFTHSLKRFFKKEKQKLHFGGFLLGWLSGLLVFFLAAVVFSFGGWGAIALGLGASVVAAVVATYAFKNKNIGRSAVWGLMAYLGTILALFIAAIIFLLSCDCFG